jgi:hypothetical protein
MSSGSSAVPKFQGNPLKITTVKPWIRACFAQSPSNALQFLLSDGRRASIILPTGTVIRDLQGLEACRDKIVRVSASYDGSCVAALTSDGYCWLHNCALGQSQAIGFPPPDSLPFQFSAKCKRQQLWDVQLEACAATSLVCFSWLGPAGNLISSLPFYSACAVFNSREVVWAKHEEQAVAGAITLGSCVCSATVMSSEGWVVMNSTLEANAVADAPDDSWNVKFSCLLFSMKESTSEPVGTCTASFSFQSPFSSIERAQLSKRARSLHSSRQRPAIFAVHGGEGMVALILNCGSPCLYFFNTDTVSDKSVNPKVCLPLDSAPGVAQDFVCDAAWLCKGWWLVLLLSSGKLLVLDRRGVLLSPFSPGVVTMASATKQKSFIQLPRDILGLHENEWTVSAHPVQPYVAVCTGFFISVVLLPSPNNFIASALSAIDQISIDPTQDWAQDYALSISQSSHVTYQPSCANDAIVLMSHLWCLALSNPVALDVSIFDKFCKALSNSLVSLASVDDSKGHILAHSLRAFLTAGHQATYLCPHSYINQSQKLDFSCIHVIVAALVTANLAEDAAVLLCACRKRCDDSRNVLLQSQHISCVRYILNIWNAISVKAIEVIAASETAALQEILNTEGISLSPIGSSFINRKNEAIIAHAISPSATSLESAVFFCRAGQSVAALCALINGGHVAAVVAATLRMQGVLTGSSCAAMLSSAIMGKCWKLQIVDMLPDRDLEELTEDATLDDCLAFIIKTTPGAAVLSVVRFAVAVGALSLCSNSNIELLCLSSSQCSDTQSEFIDCPVRLRLRLSSDPGIMLGKGSEHEDCQPISVRSCFSAFKDVLSESIDHAFREASSPSGLELAWVLCLVAGCGSEAALLAVASVEMTNAFTSLLSFCNEVSAASIKLQSSDFAVRISNFKASVCDWISGNADLLSSFFLSPANVELLQFSSGLCDALFSSHVTLNQVIEKCCSDAIKLEILNLCRHIAGDHNVALNSNIKDACYFLAFQSRSEPNHTKVLVLVLWAFVDNQRSAILSTSGSISSKMSTADMIKAQVLLEYAIAISHLDTSFLQLSATCCVDSVESSLRSGSGLSVSRQHLISNISLLCLAVRKGAIPEQRHRLRAIAQSIKSISAHASSMINSLFETEFSHLHEAEFQALEADLLHRCELLKEAQSSPHDQALIADLRTSADSVLGSLSEELWVCHCALLASCCLMLKDTNFIASAVLVPQLCSSIVSFHTALLPNDDLNDTGSCGSQIIKSVQSVDNIDDIVARKILSPRKESISVNSNHLPMLRQPELPVEPHDPILISSDQLLCSTRKLDAHESSVNAIVISSDRSFIFSAGDDRSIRKWAIDRFFCVSSVLLDKAVSCLSVTQDGVPPDFVPFCPLLISGLGEFIFSGGNEIVVWTHELRRVHTILKECQHPVLSIAISADYVLHASSW